ncbi:hypothetical protein E2F47_07590 [Mycobacterium eburneum]|nr:hypothetical protein E2F47_07590 [Mycobacterium eburneum]
MLRFLLTRERLQLARTVAKAVLGVALSYIALYAAIFGVFLTIWLYIPVARLFHSGPLLTAVVWIQMAVMVGGVALLVYRRPIARIPVMLFTVTTLAFGAWLVLNPFEWLPHPT